MISYTQIQALKEDTLGPLLDELKLITDKPYAEAKRDLYQWYQWQCEHPDVFKLYDVTPLLCPECETLLEYDFDTDHNKCGNCGETLPPEISGSMDDMETFVWLDKCIGCPECRYQGHPDEQPKNPFLQVDEVSGW